MLTSISPLGERGRGHRWGVTMGWLALGHVVGGLALGGLVALAALGVDALTGGDPGDAGRAAVVVVVAVATVAVDLGGGRIPIRRQVDETWLRSFRGWVYGFGFGVQLGFGLVTVVNTALMAIVLVAGALAGPTGALVAGLVHGLTRAVVSALSGRVRTVDDLKALHRRLDAAAEGVRLTAPGALLALLVSLGMVAIT